MNLTFRPCTMSDLETLRDFSRTKSEAKRS